MDEPISIIPDTLVVLLDGDYIKTEKQLYEALWSQLFFPDPDSMNWDAYMTWMQSLSWIPEHNIAIVIQNRLAFLETNLYIRLDFMKSLMDIILPFWENRPEKTIRVYLTGGDSHAHLHE